MPRMIICAAFATLVAAGCSSLSPKPQTTPAVRSSQTVQVHGSIMYIDANTTANHDCAFYGPWTVDVKDGSGKILRVITVNPRTLTDRHCTADYSVSAPKAAVYQAAIEDTSSFKWSTVFAPVTSESASMPTINGTGY